MTPASTTHYVYDRAGRLIAESSGAGAALREYIWVDDMPLAVVADIDTITPKLWYVHADHLNRPARMTDDTKAVVWNTGSTTITKLLGYRYNNNLVDDYAAHHRA